MSPLSYLAKNLHVDESSGEHVCRDDISSYNVRPVDAKSLYWHWLIEFLSYFISCSYFRGIYLRVKKNT